MILHRSLLAVQVNAMHHWSEKLDSLLQHKSLNGALAIWIDAHHLLRTEECRAVDNSRAGLKWRGAMNADALMMGDVEQSIFGMVVLRMHLLYK
jgi:hypothetical protein